MEYGLFFNLVIGVLVIVALYLIKETRQRVTWYENLMILGIPILFSVIFMLIVLNAKTRYAEYWGSTIEYIYEEEPYNEWVHRTCSESYACGTDSKGNTQYCTRYYDCSYQNDVYPSWTAITTIGERIDLTEEKYYEILRTNNNVRSVIKRIENYAPNDRAYAEAGSKFYGQRVGEYSYQYQTKCSQEIGDVYPIMSKHRYVNKVKATDYSALGFQMVDTAEAKFYQLYEYPEMESEFHQNVFLGGNVSREVQELYNDLNGLIGVQKQCKMFVCIFNNQPVEAALKQEAYWVRGNKNELIISIGMRDGKIDWVYPFSWSFTKSGSLESDIKIKLSSYTVITDKDWKELVYFFKDEITNKFNRLQFTDGAEGFEYLKVKVPTWAIVTNLILSLLVMGGVVVFSVLNEFENNN
jgi:hypothetical protein